MRIKTIALLAIIAVIGALSYICFLHPYANFSLIGSCGVKVTAESVSKDGYYLASESLVDCGATSDYSTQIKIKDIKTGTEGLVLSLKGDETHNCSTNWTDTNTLNIVCEKPTGFVYSKLSNFEDVKIVFGP
jgi:hypothetical protein